MSPGSEVDVRVHVVTSDGRPAPSQVTLWAVDEGIFQLEPWRLPGPLRIFSAERGSDVTESDTRHDVFWERAGSHQVRSPTIREGSWSGRWNASRGS